MEIIKQCVLALTGLSAGFVVSGGVFAFLAVVGIIPRLAHKSGTCKSIRFYECAVIFGGIFGAGTIVFDYKIPVGIIGEIVMGLSYGVFLGCFAVCLAEVLNVLPILGRRAGIQKGMGYFIVALAAGKTVGALLYFFTEGFAK